MKREFDVMLCRELGKYPHMKPFLLNLIECFQLGTYIGARKRPNWHLRKLVRRTFHFDRFKLERWCDSCHKGTPAPCPHCNGKVPKADSRVHAKHHCSMCTFIRANKVKMLLAIKQYHVFQMDCMHTAKQLMELESGWTDHARTVLAACDDARDVLDELTLDGDTDSIAGPMRSLLRHLEVMHDCDKPSNTHLLKSTSVAEMILNIMNSTANKLIQKGPHKGRKLMIVDRWTGCQTPDDFLLAPLSADKLRAKVKDDDSLRKLLCCDVPLRHLGGKRWCDVYKPMHVMALARFTVARCADWNVALLAMIGMSPEAVEHLRSLNVDLSMRVMPDHAIDKEIDWLTRLPVDFHLLHAYLVAMAAHSSVELSSLDSGTAFAQARALRQRNHIFPSQALPRSSHSFYFCRHCDIFCGEVVKPASIASDRRKRPVKEQAMIDGDGDLLRLTDSCYSRGAGNTLYDARLDAVVCPRDSQSQHKFSDEGLMLEPCWLEDASYATSVRRAREAVRPCRDRPLEAVSLLGRVLRLGDAHYTLCVVCGSPCLFADETLCDEGPTCGRHERVVDASRYRCLQQFITPLTQQVRELRECMLFTYTSTLLAPRGTTPSRAASRAMDARPAGVTGTPLIDAELFVIQSAEQFRKGTVSTRTNLRAVRKSYHLVANGHVELDEGGNVVQGVGKKRRRRIVHRHRNRIAEGVTELFCRRGCVLLERVEIACAYCNRRAGTMSKFVQVAVVNRSSGLVDSLTEEALAETGCVNVWLCARDFRLSLKLLREKPVPSVSELYFVIHESRAAVNERVKHKKFRW